MSLEPKNHPIITAPAMSLMFLASFLLTGFFGALLLQIGSPPQFASLLMLLFLISGYIFVGIYGKTMGLDAFQFADRMASPWTVAQASASAIISSSVFILLAGQFYATGVTALSHYWGWLLGIALIVVLFAAKVRRSNAVTLPSLVATGDKSTGLNFLLIFISIMCSALLILFQLEFAGYIGERILDFPRTGTILAVVLAAGICVVFGGMQSVTIIRQVAYPIILLCFMTPIIWIALKVSGIAIPQFTFGGSALQSIAEIDKELVSAGLETPEEVFDLARDGSGADAFSYLATLICIAFGIAAMPHIIQHSATVQKPNDARNAGIGTYALVLLVLTAIPAFAAFVRLDLYTSLLGLQLSDLASDANWIFELSGGGEVPLISLCGSFISSMQEAIEACGETSDYFISVSDIGINPDLIALTSATLYELPALMTILIATGAMFALLTSIDGQFLSIGLTLSNDGYQRLMRPKSPKSVRLFMTRFLIIIGIATLSAISLYAEPEPLFLFESSMALSAACLFPALVSRLWFPSASNQSILVSIASGFVLTAGMLVLFNLGPDLMANTNDELILPFPGLTDEITNFGAGFIGLMATILSFIVCKFLSVRELKNQGVVDAQA